MEAYQQRVVDEKTEVDARLERLTAFMNSDVWSTIGEYERKRMERQAVIMAEYSAILGERIDNF